MIAWLMNQFRQGICKHSIKLIEGQAMRSTFDLDYTRPQPKKIIYCEKCGYKQETWG